MPPSPKISKEQIIENALSIIKEESFERINARSLANKMGCSTKPIFRIYENMERLKDDVYKEIDLIYIDFIKKRMNKDEILISLSIAYCEFAIENKKLFNAMFMSQIMKEKSVNDILNASWNQDAINHTANKYDVSVDKAKEIFRDMWIYTHGLSTQIAFNGIRSTKNEIIDLIKNAFDKFINERV